MSGASGVTPSHSPFSPAAYEQARAEAAQQTVASDPLVGCMTDTHLHHLMQSAIMLTAKAREAEARQDWSNAFSFYTTALDNMAEVYKRMLCCVCVVCICTCEYP
jgi:hypothetical protein